MKIPPWLFFLFLGSLLLLPDLWSTNDRYGNIQFGLPRLTGGDEPYYMVLISSLIEDGDFDLRNNYAEALAGGWQAGQRFSRRPIGHHSCWFEGSKRSGWWAYYGRGDRERWMITQDKHIVPVPLIPGVEPPSNQPDYSCHPPGSVLAILPVLLVAKPLLASCNRMDLIESVAILCTTVEIIWAAFFFWQLIKRYVTAPLTAYIITAVVFLGTPVWVYGRSLFSEPLLVLCAMGAYSLVLRNKHPLFAGLFIGIGVLVKPPFLLLAIPLFVLLSHKRDFRGIVNMAIPLAGGCIAVLWLNNFMFGSPFHTAQEWISGNILNGITALLLSPNHGILPIIPIALIAFASWPSFWRQNQPDAAVILSGFGVYFLLMALWFAWDGGACYGPRLILPVIPLLLVPLAYGFENYTSIWQKSLFWIFASISVLINGYAAFPYWACWNQSPLFMVLSMFFPGIEKLEFPTRLY